MTAPVKTCVCGRSFDRVAFLSLPMPPKGGRQADGEGGWLAARNCPCGSTLCVPFAQLTPPKPRIR